MGAADCRLYLITPPSLDPASFGAALAAALEAGDIGAVQLRLKQADDDEVRRAVDSLLPVADAYGVEFILNDRADLAAETGCDGVHLGQEDGSFEDARRLLGPSAVIGVTCHDSRDLALAAGERGADYVAFGAFFPTETKRAKTRARPEILEWWSEVTIVPCVAIGGITPENCAPLVAAGADFLAVVSAVWEHPEGPAAAVRAFDEAIEKAASGDVASSAPS